MLDSIKTSDSDFFMQKTTQHMEHSILELMNSWFRELSWELAIVKTKKTPLIETFKVRGKSILQEKLQFYNQL